jgi:primosomal protein N' (replication factor Y) (superfamily II helicase)
VIARVEPLTRTRAVRGPFDYLLRSDQGDVGVGSLLRIPFGASRTLGVVVSIAEGSELDPDRLVEPEAVLPAVLPPDLVLLASWMAAEYCSTPARALALLLPPGAAGGVRRKRVLVAELTASGREALDGDGKLNDRQRDLLAHLGQQGPTVAAELGTSSLRRLEARGLVSIAARTSRRRPARYQVSATSAAPPLLTADQRAALEVILAALASAQRAAAPESDARFLLHGVTGSGKTEVYLQAVAATLAAGRSAIVLVPEIALTPQALARFEARFGGLVAVLHSGLPPGERYDEWETLAAGEARVCVGPRSAVFAPLSNIGLIIVDEEHESSYKHEGDPRYDARTVAEQRAREHGSVLLVGSATPRPESARSLRRLRLGSRIDGRALPPVEVLDMRGTHHPLHPVARMALVDVRRARAKAIVLLNRRGWSNFLSCRACGHVWMCPNCEVTLVMHRSGGFVACHHCGHREPLPERCGACGSPAVARHGAGTERIEHELREALGAQEFPVFRLDADVASASARAKTLERFGAAQSGLLVGTQMVAKGHDFPDVALGLVLDADHTLRFPDFRAEERTFALITQLAGRAGRGGETTEPGEGRGASGDGLGRVLVQTLSPDARAIRFAAHHDADGFLAGELQRREALRYPPFASLIRIVCSAPDAADAHAVADALKAEIDPPGAAVMGPAPLFALRGRARSQVVIKATDRAAAIAAAGAAVDALARSRAARGVSLSVDVDPQ